MITLPPKAFRRADESEDEHFYAFPRFVTHIDDNAILQVTALYHTYFPPNGVILDLMSSWVSHLPIDLPFSRVVGHGMNAEELAANPQLNDRLVHDLNLHPTLPFLDSTFDGVACAVSVQYLTRPIAVFAEVARILKAGAPFVVTLSNRVFAAKAVNIWLNLDDLGRIRLVQHYFGKTDAFERITVHRWQPLAGGDPLYGVIGFARE